MTTVKSQPVAALLSAARPVMYGLFCDVLAMHGVTAHARNELEVDRAITMKMINNHGVNFVCKQLSSLGRDFDRGLMTGQFTLTESHFGKTGQTEVRYLNTLVSKVFDRNGRILDDADVAAIADVRQICFAFYKYELDVKDTFDAETKAWLEVDDRCAMQPLTKPIEVIVDKARGLLESLFYCFDARDIVPTHSNGAVATGEKNVQKWTPQLQRVGAWDIFNPALNIFGNARNFETFLSMGGIISRQPREACNSKLLFVPKDARGPRAICEEPLQMQYMQQGLMRKLYHHVEKHHMTRGHVNFTDQRVNRDLAKVGSSIGGSHYMTLDMKEASDRISMTLVERLFPPAMVEVFVALRSDTVGYRLNGSDKTRKLNKFAPMGSALCFPVMSLVHWALSVATLMLTHDKDFSDARDLVYVYGDDIILKGCNPTPVVKVFQAAGLQFNTNKCCFSGFFRESCGMDAWKGQEVMPVRLKSPVPMSDVDATAVAAWVGYANHLFDRGYYNAANIVEALVEDVVGLLPIVRSHSDVLGWTQTRQQGSLGSHTRLPRIKYQPGKAIACDLLTRSRVFVSNGHWDLSVFYKGLAVIARRCKAEAVTAQAGDLASYIKKLSLMARQGLDTDASIEDVESPMLLKKWSTSIVSW